MSNSIAPGHFADLEIRIFPRQERGYPVEVTLDNQQEFQTGYLSADILPWISSGDLAADGHKLFALCMADNALHSAWCQARGQSAQRRLRLRIDPSAPELHALPWELLHEEGVMLAANAATPFSRYLPVSEPWGGAVHDRPVRVLAVISNPYDLQDTYNLAPLDVEAERSILEQAFVALNADDIELDFLDAPVTLERLEEKLQQGYHILHYIGHGVFNKRKQQAALFMQDDEGDTQIVKDEALIGMLTRQRMRPRLVFLAACQSAARSTADAFLGLGPRLVAAGVPAVVAMQDFVAIKTARKLSLAFYRRLAEHSLVDCAMNEARGALLTAGRPDAAVPVLFMRLRSGQLWGSESSASPESRAAEPDILPPPEIIPPPQVSHFVGRAAELALLAEKLAALRSLVISGMPGVGKTALVAVLAGQASEPRQTFWHSFNKDEGVGDLVWKLAGFLYWHGQEDIWRMLQRTRLSGGQLPPARELLDYVAQQLRGQGYLLCLDDFQFLSEDDSAMLAKFIRRIASEMTSSVIMSQVVPAWASPAEIIALAGLSPEDTHRLLVERGLDLGELEAALYAHTGGNAQFLMLSIDALRSSQAPARLIERLAETDNIERYLMNEVDKGLNDGERRVMSGVSILLGYPGTRDAIETVLDTSGLRRTLSELGNRSLLTVGAGKMGKEYGENAILQSFYYSLLSRAERRTRHRRAGEYYASEEPDALRAARHFVQSGEFARAAALLTADVWGLINQGQARRLNLLLEQIGEPQVTAEQWVRLKLALGQVQAVLGDRELARQSYEVALARLRRLPGASETKTQVTLPKIWDKLEDKRPRDITAVLDRLEGTAETDTPEVQALRIAIYVGLSDLARDESPQEALQWLEQGLEAAGDAQAEHRVTLLLKKSTLEIAAGNFQSALETIQRCMKRMPTKAQRLRAGALTNLGMIYSNQGDLEKASQVALEALAINESLQDYFHMITILINLGTYRSSMGNFAGAMEVYQQARTLAERLGMVRAHVLLALNLGFIHTRLGSYEQAKTLFATSLTQARENALARHEVYIRVNWTAVHVYEEDFVAATEQLTGLEQTAQALNVNDQLPEIYRLQAQIQLGKNDLSAAQQWAKRSLASARELGLPLEEGISLCVWGQVAAANGQLQAALEAFEHSLQRLEGKDPYEAARTKMEWGQALVAGGETARGKEMLQAARTAFEKLGAQRDLANVEEILRGLQ